MLLAQLLAISLALALLGPGLGRVSQLLRFSNLSLADADAAAPSELLQCPQSSGRGGISVVVSASRQAAIGHASYIAAMEFYCLLHAYEFLLVNPQPIHDHYSSRSRVALPSDTARLLKPVTILHAFREVFSRHKCDARWLVFVDVDVFVAEFERSLEAVIEQVVQSRRPASSCHMIGQDSPSTLNSGFLFLAVSPQSLCILQKWIGNVLRGVQLDVHWLQDQGWLQQTVIELLEEALNSTIHFDCGSPVLQNMPRQTRGTPVSMRNLCYVKVLQLLGLRLQSRSFGGACLSPGLSALERFNLKDWNGETFWNGDLQRLDFQVSGLDKDSRCGLLPQIFAYHGRNDSLVSSLERNFHCAMLRRWRPEFDSSASPLLLWEYDRARTNQSSCSPLQASHASLNLSEPLSQSCLEKVNRVSFQANLDRRIEVPRYRRGKIQDLFASKSSISPRS